jgi:hypothetical protein
MMHRYNSSRAAAAQCASFSGASGFHCIAQGPEGYATGIASPASGHQASCTSAQGRAGTRQLRACPCTLTTAHARCAQGNYSQQVNRCTS